MVRTQRASGTGEAEARGSKVPGQLVLHINVSLFKKRQQQREIEKVGTREATKKEGRIKFRL